MPNLPNARKALRQSVKKAKRNKIRLDEITSLRRRLRSALKKADTALGQKLAHQIGQAVDKAAGKKIIKKNKAARIKSRIARGVLSLTSTH